MWFVWLNVRRVGALHRREEGEPNHLFSKNAFEVVFPVWRSDFRNDRLGNGAFDKVFRPHVEQLWG